MRPFFSFILFVLLVGGASAQAIIYVDRGASPGGDGRSWGGAKKTIAEGIAAASAAGGGEVWVTADTYVEPVVLASGVTLLGGFSGTETSPDQRGGSTTSTIDVDSITGPVRPLTGASIRNVLVERFILTNGHVGSGVPHNGGGVHLTDVDNTVTLLNCVVRGNNAEDGGGIYCATNAKPSIYNCTVENNDATDDGGGIYYSDHAGGLVQGCSIASNRASDFGGGIYTSVSSPVNLSQSEVRDNTARTGGGGMAIRASSATISETLFSGNTAASNADGGGGVLAIENSTVTMTGGAFSRNAGGASNHGGGMRAVSSAVNVTDVFFYQNSATLGAGFSSLNSSGSVAGCNFTRGTFGGGGGMFLEGTSPLVEDCIIYANEGLTASGIYLLGANGTIRNCTISTNSATGQAGAIFADTGTTTLFDRCNIVGNVTSASGNGSIVIRDSSPHFQNTIFSGNRSDGFGLAIIFGADTKPVFENCTIAGGNSGGGKIADVFNSADPIFLNCIIDATATSGINLRDGGNVSLLSCLIIGSDGAVNDAGNNAELAANPRYAGSFFGNPRFFQDSGFAFAFTYEHDDFEYLSTTESTTISGSGLEDVGPLIPGSLVGRTLRLPGDLQRAIIANTATTISIAGEYAPTNDSGTVSIADYNPEVYSPAIDAGSPNGAVATVDYIGLPRRVDVVGVGATGSNAIDIGAYEYRANLNPAVTNRHPIYVDSKASNSTSDGSSWVNAYTSIRQALTSPRVAVDPIWIAEGNYYGASDLVSSAKLYGGFRSGDLDLSDRDPEKHPAVLLTNGTTPSLLSGDGVSNVVIDGLTFDRSSNNAVAQGGGLNLTDSNNIGVDNCLFTKCRATSKGGGIYLESTTLVNVGRSRFIESEANGAGGLGGAIYIGADSGLIVEDCFFSGNFAKMGGAIAAENSSLSVRGSEFRHNEANGTSGGAIHTDNVDPYIEVCYFVGNIAKESGGAVATFRGDLSATENDYVENMASVRGLAVTVESGQAVISRSRFAGNHSGAQVPSAPSGTLYFDNQLSRVLNSVIDGNRAVRGTAGIATSGDAMVEVSFSTITANLLENGPGSAAIATASSSINFSNTIFTPYLSSSSGATPPPLLADDSGGSIGATSCLFPKGDSLYDSETNGAVDSIDALNALAGFEGNIAGDPRFLYPRIKDVDSGRWTANSQTGNDGNTTFTDATASFQPGALVGLFLDPNTASPSRAFIVANTQTTITIDLGFVDAKAGDSYRLIDRHIALESPAVDRAAGSGPNLDLEGMPRPVDVPGLGSDGAGLGYDIGAYEQQTPVSPNGIPDVVYVGIDAPSTGDGLSWVTAYPSIQQAIDDPRSATRQIWIEMGGYHEHLLLQSGRQLIGGFRLGDLTFGARPAASSSNLFRATGNTLPLARAINVSNITFDRIRLFDSRAAGASPDDNKGGGVRMVSAGGTNLFRDCYFGNNRTTFGGGIYMRESAAQFQGVEFVSNGADTDGGALYMEGTSSATLADVQFHGNSAGAGGGALFVTGESTLTAGNIFFDAHTANVGAAVYLQGGTITLRNSQMSNAFANDGGGLITITGGAFIMDGFTMTNASAAIGSAIQQTSGHLTMTNGILTNFADTNGTRGTLALLGGISTLENVDFSGNSARPTIDSEANTITLRHVTILNNQGASLRGKNSTVTIDASDFGANRNGQSSSLVDLSSATATITNSVFSGHADAFTSIVSLDVGELDVVNSTLAHNMLTGAAVDVRSGNARIRNSIFANNRARAIQKASAATIDIDTNLFFDNDAYRDGTTAYSSVAELNALGNARNNIEGDPRFAMETPLGATADVAEIQGGGFSLVDIQGDFSDVEGRLVGIDSLFRQAYVTRYTGVDIVFDSAYNVVEGDQIQIIDYRTVLGSPAIDAAAAQFAPATDFTGRARPRELPGIGNNQGFDIGAYELYPQEVRTDPIAVDFGDVALTATRQIRVQNLGDFPVAFTGTRTAIIGDAGGHFSLVGPPLPDLNPGSFFNLSVRFAPTSAGMKTATLLITSTDPVRPNLEVPLAGNGTVGSMNLARLLFHLLGLPTDMQPADVNGDGILDAADLRM